MSSKEKKPFYKRPIVWIVVVVILIIIGVSSQGGDNSTSKTNDTSSQSSTPKEEKEVKKLSIQDTYDKLKTGMSKKEVEKIIGKDTGTCTVTENDLVGKIEACTYGSTLNNIFDGGMIMINYTNDKLDMKTISKF